MRQQTKRDLPETSAFVDDSTADILEKKVHPYRPPGTGGAGLSPITQGLLEETGINVLVDPIKIPNSEDNAINFNGNIKIPAKGPHFDARRSKNVTALKGVTTNLICRVRMLGNHTVGPMFLNFLLIFKVGICD